MMIYTEQDPRLITLDPGNYKVYLKVDCFQGTQISIDFRDANGNYQNEPCGSEVLIGSSYQLRNKTIYMTIAANNPMGNDNEFELSVYSDSRELDRYNFPQDYNANTSNSDIPVSSGSGNISLELTLTFS